ncbi:hypothetical protein ACFQ1S_36005, partial [Kibdelosporangium lantanae]
LAAAEQRVGHRLDRQHGEFLSHTNGWPGFYLDSSLLSADDLGAADEGLDAFYAEAPPVPPRDEIYPISANPHSATTFAIWRAGPDTAGGRPVLWLPWADTEPYANFADYFEMVFQAYEEIAAEAV